MDALNSDMHVELDVGNLCVLTAVKLKSPINSNLGEDFLKDIATEGIQQLVNEIFKLPSEYHKGIPVAKLPKPTTAVPREKPIPQQRPLTRWEKYAQSKGIQRKKKDKMVWDEELKDWVPDFVHRRSKNRPHEFSGDSISSMKKQKKERMAKNEYQRLMNVADRMNLKVTTLESVGEADKLQLTRSVAAAKTATRSLGLFTKGLPDEKPPKDSLKKRKFAPNIQKDFKQEKENNLRILEGLSKKRPQLDIQEGLQFYFQKVQPKDGKPQGKRKPKDPRLKYMRYGPEQKVQKHHIKRKNRK